MQQGNDEDKNNMHSKGKKETIVYQLNPSSQLLFEDALISILYAPVSVIPYVKSYGFYLFICFPIVVILGVLSQFIRVDGQPKFASVLIIIANVTNIILDYVFLGIFHMGIEGASLAMLIGYIIAFICVFKYFSDSKRRSFGYFFISWFSLSRRSGPDSE